MEANWCKQFLINKKLTVKMSFQNTKHRDSCQHLNLDSLINNGTQKIISCNS